MATLHEGFLYDDYREFVRHLNREFLRTEVEEMMQLFSGKESFELERIPVLFFEKSSSTLLLGKECESERIVCMASCFSIAALAGPFLYVADVFVREEFRGRGIGKRLMLEVVSLARHRGYRYIELTSRPSREAANAMYKSLGFVERETNQYRLVLT